MNKKIINNVYKTMEFDTEKFISDPEFRVVVFNKYFYENELYTGKYERLIFSEYFPFEIIPLLGKRKNKLPSLFRTIYEYQKFDILVKFLICYPKHIKEFVKNSIIYEGIKQSDKPEVGKFLKKYIGKIFVEAFFKNETDLVSMIIDDFEDLLDHISFLNHIKHNNIFGVNGSFNGVDSVKIVIQKIPNFFSKFPDYTFSVDDINIVRLLIIENYGKKINPITFPEPKKFKECYEEIGLKDFLKGKKFRDCEEYFYLAKICEDFVYDYNIFMSEVLNYSPCFVYENIKIISKLVDRIESDEEKRILIHFINKKYRFWEKKKSPKC